MKIDIPPNHYIKGIEVNATNVEINLAEKKRIALVFISLNDRYWPYLSQVIKDCRKNFLPQHNVDYFAWTDFNAESKQNQLAHAGEMMSAWEQAPSDKKQDHTNNILSVFAQLVRLYEYFMPKEIQAITGFLKQQGMEFKRDGAKFWVESTHPMAPIDVAHFVNAIQQILTASINDLDKTLEGVNIVETEAVPWPTPTLMRYHLFLNEEEKLKDYDYIFYLDADMRVVAKISDELLNDGLLAAEHPMYSLRKEYIPPYEPNEKSTAYISRPGRVIDENGKSRFKPYYYAGGIQGGKAPEFIEAMKTMKKNIDKDFDNNYVAIWNDESHWNKYLAEYKGDLKVLSPSYVYPDSLIKEYYEKVWGCSYEPKIITLTKPFSLSSQGAEEINKFIQQ